MAIGYACQTIGIPDAEYRTCRKANADSERIRELTRANLSLLERQIRYNKKNGIRLFRISSDVVPFGSDDSVGCDWQSTFREYLTAIGAEIQNSGQRVSMHPGQYTVLNSPDPDVVTRAVRDLEYHADFLDALGTGPESKLILHVGGVYGDKSEAIRRFIRNWKNLPENVRARLAIENDERLFSPDDTLFLHEAIGIPVIFDNLHYRIRMKPATPEETFEKEIRYIRMAAATFGPLDGRPKMHYSEQAVGKRPGAHADSIRSETFLSSAAYAERERSDIMLEGKDKNLSAIKCALLSAETPDRAALEREWARYKYFVMSRDQNLYTELREMFGHGAPTPANFYRRIAAAKMRAVTPQSFTNAAQHIWGYVSEEATRKERETFFAGLSGFKSGTTRPERTRDLLFRLAVRGNRTYLIDSLFFYLPLFEGSNCGQVLGGENR